MTSHQKAAVTSLTVQGILPAMAPSTLPLESSPLLFNKHFNLICICSIQVFPYPACVFLRSGCCLLFWRRDTSERFPSAPHSELAGTRAEFLKQASRKMNKMSQNEWIFMGRWKAATATVKLVKLVKVGCLTCLPSHKVSGDPLSRAEGLHVWTAQCYPQLWFPGTTVRKIITKKTTTGWVILNIAILAGGFCLYGSVNCPKVCRYLFPPHRRENWGTDWPNNVFKAIVTASKFHAQIHGKTAAELNWFWKETFV